MKKFYRYESFRNSYNFFKNLIWILTKFNMKKDIKQFIFMYFLYFSKI